MNNEVENATKTDCNILNLNDNTTIYYQICTETSKGSTCEDGNIKTIKLPGLAGELKLGDYISMTPTSTSYIISQELTGYTRDLTINPSELNLWRVIGRNSDGTVDIISNNISSWNLPLTGLKGFRNSVGLLNLIAAQYTNDKYVIGSRNFGYSNQKEFCTGILNQSSCSDLNWGAGDDIEKVMTALGTLGGRSLSGSSTGAYWISGRYIGEIDGSVVYDLPYVDIDGLVRVVRKVGNDTEITTMRFVRPILTLNAM